MKRTLNPQLIFDHACRFLGSDQLLREIGKPGSGREFTIASPAMVLSAFAAEKCGSAFENLRYYYEDPAKVVYYIGDFAWILGRVIVEIKPEWTSPAPLSSCRTSKASVA